LHGGPSLFHPEGPAFSKERNPASLLFKQSFLAIMIFPLGKEVERAGSLME